MRSSESIRAIIGSAIGAGVAAAAIGLSSCAPGAPDPSGQAGNQVREPSELKGERNFATLINSYRSGQPKNPVWAGAWWAYKRNGSGFWGNGIAANVHGNATPAGKYDAAHCGRTHVQEWEVKHHGTEVKDAEGWWGHCNGWSVAAALFPEPREPAVVNGIRFEVADIKAVLTEASMLSSMDFFGARMAPRIGTDSLEYSDVAPDVFFLVFTNFMGKFGLGVLLDQDTGPAVWNQPVAGYLFDRVTPSDYLGVHPRARDIHRVVVRSEVWWASDNIGDPGMTTPSFEFKTDFPFESRKFEMEVWLDAPPVFDSSGNLVSSGNVVVTRVTKDGKDYQVGGDWRMKDFVGRYGYDWEHLWPDYLWVPYTVMKAKDYPNNDVEAYGNPDVDIDWVREHLLVPGGKDTADYNGKPCSIPSPPPSPTPSPSASPSPRPR